MKHVNFNSGGIGSWATLKRIVARYGTADVTNLFTDTLIEDRDLYRFLIESTAEVYGIDRPVTLLAKCADIPDVTSDKSVEERKAMLAEISAEAMRLIPGLVWISDGRQPWEVFRDVRYLGNSRIAQCSHLLKQAVAERWLRDNFPLIDTPNDDGSLTLEAPDVTLYLGIDWTEDHRTAAPVRNWAPYPVKFPMCEEPYVDKADMLRMLDEIGIERPRLYGLKFAHNNCSGFCVRAGQGHFANLLAQFPKQYAYHERKEQDLREFLGKDVTMMKKVRDKITYRLTMKELRESIEGPGACDVDYEDIGGCGCFVNY